MARRSIYATRASDWIGSVLADDGRAIGAGSGLFVSERIEFGWIDPKSALVEAQTAGQAAVSTYALDAAPLVEISARALKPVADDVLGSTGGSDIDLEPFNIAAPDLADSFAVAMGDSILAMASDLSFATKAGLAEAIPLTAVERLARVADGDFLSMQTIDVFGASFLTPGFDAFSKTSFQLIDLDGDGVDEFIVRLDEQGPTLMGTDFLI